MAFIGDAYAKVQGEPNSRRISAQKASTNRLQQRTQAYLTSITWWISFCLTPYLPSCLAGKRTNNLLKSDQVALECTRFLARTRITRYSRVGSVDSDVFQCINDFLRDIERKLVVMDNSPIHTSRHFKRISLWRSSLEIFYLSKYSPELNV